MAMNPSTQNKRFGHFNHARFMSASALTAAGMVFLSAPALAENWTDHTAIVGNISIDTAIPNTTNITQHTHFTKVQGNGDINAGWTVNVAQPSSSSKYVLYDTKGDPTRIMGSLNANGEIYIFDQNGVIFGADSRVDVGSLITSTGFITDADILNNDGKLAFVEVADGAIELNGTISVAEAGLAAFVAPTISNSGVINAKMGKVAMAAGERVTLDLYGDNLVEIALDDKISGALIDNSGIINAAGGTVVLKAEAAKDIVNNVINMSGAINASSASVQGGKIVLGGGANGAVNVSGKLDASGKTGGGKIDVKGQNVLVAETAEINADAVENGNGGRIDLIADKNMAFHGYASAKGGSESGNGGSAEISGYETLGFTGLVNMSADNGARGSLLLDPTFSVVHSGALPVGLLQNYVISARALALSLADTDITLQADNFIDIGTRAGGYTNQGWTGNAITDAIITAGLNNLSNGDIDLSTWNFLWLSGATSGSLTLDSNTINFNRNLAMGNGDLIVNGGAGGINWLANVTMNGGGDINASTGGAQTFTNSILRTAGNINLVANGNIRQTDTVSGLIADRFSATSVNGAIDLQAQNDFNALDDVIAKNSVVLADRVGGVSVDGTVSGSAISMTSHAGDMHVNGDIVATNNLSLFTGSGKALHLNDGSTVSGNNVALNVQGGATQHAGSSITANTLSANTGVAGANIYLDGANRLTNLGNVTINRGNFRLNEMDGFTLTGNITTKSPSLSGVGGNIEINTHGTTHAQGVTTNNGTQILSHGGDISINTNGGAGIVKGGSLTVNGTIDARGTSIGDINLTTRQLVLNGNSKVYADLLTTDGALVNQNANGVIEANGLTGTLASYAAFRGTNNNIGTLHNFTTGLHNSLDKDFLLVDNGGLVIDGNVSSNGGDIAIDSRTTAWNQDVKLSSGKTIASKGGDIAISNTSGRALIAGKLDARGSLGDIDITANEIQFHGGENVFADTLTLNATGSQIWQNASSQIHANTLAGSSRQGTSLIGTNNNIGNLGDFTTGASWNTGGFNLVNASGKRFNISGAITTTGGDINIQHNEELRLLAAGSLQSDGGDVRLSNKPGVRNAFIYVDGEIGSNGGDVDIESTSNIVLRNGSSIDAGTLNLVSGNIVEQAAGSKIIAQKLEGTVDKHATLIGTNNNVATIGDFTTGAHWSAAIPGGLTLHDVDGFTVLGAVTTKGGDIAVTTNSNSFDKAITIASSGSLKSGGGDINLNNNGASGGFITVQGSIDARGTTGSGDVTLNARQLRAQNGSTIYADLLTTNGALVNQQAGSAITASKLVGTLTANALFAGTNNNIKEIGNFATGLSNGNGGFTLVNASGQRLDVTGKVSTTGGDVKITHNNRLDVRSSGEIVTKGGDVNLTVNTNSFIYADGLIDTRDAGGNGAVTLDSKSNIEMRNGGKIYAGLVTLNSGNIVNQATGALIDADKLEGTVDKTVDLKGTNNAIRSIGNFTTGAHPIATQKGGFKLVNGVDTDIVGALLGGQGNIDLDIGGDVNVVAGGSVNAEGGNIDIDQTGIFKSVANTLKTSGTGTIDIEQRVGGSINQAVNAFDNSGTGLNTALIHDGTYVENVSIVDSNVHLLSANGRGATTIEGITNGDEATLWLGGVNNVTIGGAGQGFTIVGIDNPSPGIESAAVFLKNSNSNIRIEDNEIVANGELGLVSHYGMSNDNITIHNNIFSGKTYAGATWGVGNQWTVPNVARQLVALNQGSSNVSFTDNVIDGDSGNNTQVTIDAAGATITGNDFSGTTAGGYLLRVRGSDTDVSGNTFDSAGLSGSAAYFLASANALGAPANIPGVFAANTFIGKTVHADNYTSDQIIHTMIQPVVNAAASGANVYASAGTFNESVTLNKSLTLHGAARADTIIKGNGTGNGITFTADDISVRELTVDNFNNGLFFGTDVADISFRNVTTSNNARGGLFVSAGATVTDLSTNNVRFEDNNIGMFIRGSVDGLDMHGGVFTRNNQGMIATFNGALDDGSILKNASVRNVTFVNNAQKAIYMEKLSDATFENLDIRTSGTSGAYPVAIDINLKHQDYQNITFDGTKIRDSGTGANGSALSVKARNDGVYETDPASLTGLVIKNSDIVTTGAHAIVVGNDVSEAKIHDNTVTGVNTITVYGGVKDIAIEDNTLNASETAIGVDGSDGVEIVRNDIDGGTTGIHLNKTSNATVGGSATDANTIKNITGGWNSAGIRIKDGSGNVVSYNELENMSGQGIVAEGTWGMANAPLTISNNAITNTAHNAISLAHWNGATVSGNVIDGTTIGNGIYLDLARNTRILDNDIKNVKNDGIHLRRGNQNTTIQGNDIQNAKNGIVLGRIGSEINSQTLIGSMGVQNPSQANTISSVNTAIQADGAENTWIEGNVISDASFAGIELTNGTGYTIVNFNDIDDSHDGIRLVNTSGLIAGNNVGLNGPMTGHGITVQSSNGTQVLTNTVHNVALRGVNVIGGQNIDVRNNDLLAIGRSGIRIDQVDGSNVSNNKLVNIGSSGIELQAGSNAVVKSNTLNDINGNGIQASVTRNVEIANSIVDDVLLAGIYVNGIRDTNAVTGNVVSNAKERGFYATGNNNASIVFAGNSFTNNPVGAQFQSGTIDLTGTANTFDGGINALVFDPTINGDPSKLVLVNDTLGSTVFTGQSGNYVTLLNGAFYNPAQPTHIDALLSRFDGLSASDFVGNIMSGADIATLEGKIWHYVDDNSLGLIYFHVPAPAPGYDEEDVMAYFSPTNIQSSSMSVTINGMPQVPGGTTAQALNNLSPFAGGNDEAAFLNAIAPAAGGEMSAEQLSDINPASGSAEATCWSDAAGYMQQGQAVNINYGSSFEDTLNGAVGCSGLI